MTEADDVERLPDDDLLGVLLHQHSRIQTLCARVQESAGAERQLAFDELRTVLAAHETATELVTRPVTTRAVGTEIAADRRQEWREALAALTRLEGLAVDGPEFAELFVQMQAAVIAHGRREEMDEFSAVLRGVSRGDLRSMVERVRTAERVAPDLHAADTEGVVASVEQALEPGPTA